MGPFIYPIPKHVLESSKNSTFVWKRPTLKKWKTLSTRDGHAQFNCRANAKFSLRGMGRFASPGKFAIDVKKSFARFSWRKSFQPEQRWFARRGWGRVAALEIGIREFVVCRGGKCGKYLGQFCTKQARSDAFLDKQGGGKELRLRGSSISRVTAAQEPPG